MTGRRPATLRAAAVLALLLASEVVPAADDHGHHDERAEAHEGTPFTVADFARFGVEVLAAAPGVVDVGVELPAEVRANADRLAHLAPRFAGVTREVRVRAGDPVRTGDVLAVVESDRLSRFEITAPFAGVVIDRHVTVGEPIAPDHTVFIVADLTTVWVDVTVHQQVVGEVGAGQPVLLHAGAGGPVAQGTVSWVSPVLDPATRAAIARVVLANPDGAWRPGMFATAVVSQPSTAPVVVPRIAVHRLDGRPVVFAVEGSRFVARPVRLGVPGRTRVAVTRGLAPGERYAATRSFLVKAELAKGEAAHDH